MAAMAAAAAMSPAQAMLVVSTRATKNVDCEAGVCIANARNAVLNANDLESMLVASDVTLQSGSRAKDIRIVAALDWASTHRLTLDSFGAIDFERPVTVNGTGAVTLATDDGGADGALSFGAKGKLTFRDTSSSLVINGAAYVLAADIATLAADIDAQPSGNFALASDYDASADGTYIYTPIDGDVAGNFEGLGNMISHFKLVDTHTSNENTALFFSVSGRLSDLRLSKVKVKGTGRGATAGLAGDCFGTISNVEVDATVEGSFAFAVGGICGDLSGTMTGSHSSGSVTGERTYQHSGVVGGLAGYGGDISRSYSTANVTGVKSWAAGGLVGQGAGTIDRSFATGAVRLNEGGPAGGLVGDGYSGTVINSYATGFTGGNTGADAGGLVGYDETMTVVNSYASGAVAAGSNSMVGGLIGDAKNPNLLADTYWDITTSGQSHGVGNDTAYPGVTGLTTEQFQAGLPSGFDPSIWAEDPAINGGLPYLPDNSPK
ncbi:MAG TPA: hypothetical protein VHZ29_10115 [Rhizomicrobium sp.]|jgi:hypothetical protein|nr:hypothetical protein [Rhizomicrobium sp.]